MTPTAIVARTDPEVLPRCRVYAETDMSFARSSGSTAGAIATADRAVPRQVRRIIETRLTRWGLPGLIDSARLLATELVTNAFEHGCGQVGVHLYLTATHLVIEVRDGSHELPVLGSAALDDEDGRGLLLVASIADHWGISPDGTTTWCSLPFLRRNGDMEQEGIVAIPALVHDESVWTRHAEFRAGEHAASNARNYTHVYLSQQPVPVDIEAAAAIGHALMANAVAYSGVPGYAVIRMHWALLPSGELVIQVLDARCDFPDFDEVMKWEPAEGEPPRGLWTARRLGAEIAYAPVESGKIVQALIKPGRAPA
ncbi:ATP-binding protein [Streptomyces pseudovenezuelae]|uniref:ATP-binding protein n=1 Tax=Streptomyces pseudovenezuelae TaxID=67350 RepID=UPI0036EE206F